jgi:CubicO group peptidase (beta-lactamase class C family)
MPHKKEPVSMKNSSARISARLRTVMEDAIDRRVFPGCAVGVYDGCGAPYYVTAGRYTYGRDAPAVRQDTIYDVASITKAIPTTMLAYVCMEQGLFTTRDRLVRFLPAFRGSFREQISIWHLLTYTLDAGFSLSSLKDLPPGEIMHRILTAPAGTPPGARFCYCNATSILLARVIEEVLGERLDVCAHGYLFAPLGMRRSWFEVPPRYHAYVVPTEDDPWRGRVVKAQVHDESAYALRPDYIAGSAGLFSTVEDLCRVLVLLVDEGVYGGRRLLAKESVAAMHHNRLGDIGVQQGLGWELHQPRFMGENASARAFGKTGFTGCVCVIDPLIRKAFVMLSNYTYPHRKTDREAINAVRRRIADVVFEP